MATSTQITAALTTASLPTPHPAFLAAILTPQPPQPLPPLNALVATARHRLLSSSLTAPQIFSPTTPALPPSLSSPSLPASNLRTDTITQVLAIEDLSKSKWEQIEALELERKGEMTKGREVIRVVNDGENEAIGATQVPGGHGNAQAAARSGPFKLLLQDVKGQQVWAFELSKVDDVGYPPTMRIGCKVLLRKGCQVSRGMLLLEPRTVLVLGGKVEEMDKQWREGREKVLRESVEQRREV